MTRRHTWHRFHGGGWLFGWRRWTLQYYTKRDRWCVAMHRFTLKWGYHRGIAFGGPGLWLMFDHAAKVQASNLSPR